jgi:hypothetical protein
MLIQVTPCDPACRIISINSAIMSDTVTADASAKAAAPSKEVPSDMEKEAALLDAFASVPQLSKAICRPGKSGGVQLQVHFAQTNLSANNKRTLQHTIHIPDASKPEQRLATGLPTELQNSSLTAISPSGEQCQRLQAQQHCAACHAGPEPESCVKQHPSPHHHAPVSSSNYACMPPPGQN